MKLGIRMTLVVVCLLALLGIGGLDYLTGPEIGLSLFYLLPIGLAAWFAPQRTGSLLAICGAAIWLTVDLASSHYSHPAIAVWNGLVRLVIFATVSFLLSRLREFTVSLQEMVAEKSAALAAEVEEHRRARDALLAKEEEERRRIGRELHDAMGQDFTALALLSKELEENLAARGLPESDLAARITRCANQAIERTRSLAAGLCPFSVGSEGLAIALAELALRASDLFGIRCQFHAAEPVPIPRAPAGLHLYRIAQEALTNAVKHGNAREVLLALSGQDGSCILRIEDDGTGLPEHPCEHSGMGISLMKYRARAMGGSVVLERRSPVGTAVVCTVPAQMP